MDASDKCPASIAPGDGIEIEWMDARGGDGSWVTEDDKSLNAGPCRVLTRGTVHKKESKFITVVLCKTIGEEDGAQYMGFITVPTASIIRINKL